MGVSNKEQSLGNSLDKRGASLSSPVYHMYPDATFALTGKKVVRSQGIFFSFTAQPVSGQKLS
jgi:hypothetical protein